MSHPQRVIADDVRVVLPLGPNGGLRRLTLDQALSALLARIRTLEADLAAERAARQARAEEWI
jgi:hypothetical protein